MTEPASFWRELRAEFDALGDSPSKSRRAVRQLEAWGSQITGGDAPLRARFRNLAKRGGLALGAEHEDEALQRWLSAVADYLRREGVAWRQVWQGSTWTAGPTEHRQVQLAAIHPQAERLGEIENWQALPGFVQEIREHGQLRELLIVLEDAEGFVVLDDDREHVKYVAYCATDATLVSCGVRMPDNLGSRAEESTVVIEHLAKASALLCAALETSTFATRTQSQPAPGTSRKDRRFVGGPHLAAWLKAEMKRRDFMTNHRLHVLTGLDRKTIKRLLSGDQVAETRLHILAAGLGVSPDDIPVD